MNTQRTDTHKPSLLDPSEYEFVSAFYQGSSDAMMKSYCFGRPSEMDEYYAAVETHPVFNGNHAAKQTCDHCGAAFAHGVLFMHRPSGELIHVGHICASNTVGLPSRAAVARKQAEKAAQEENDRIKRHEARADWQRDNADVVDYLRRMEQAEAAYRDADKDSGEPLPTPPHRFILDMIHSFNKWGSLFPNQAEAVRKFIANENKPKPKPEAKTQVVPTTPLADGRREVKGEIVSVKWTEDRGFGSQPKMLVVEADGNKVWGTVANSVFEAGHDVNNEGLRGKQVTFTATVERSRDDEHFGFFKRPAKMVVTD